jgi:hypothetical protein
MLELIWNGKYDDAGRRIAPLRVALPFQAVETVNESAQQRQRSLDFFAAARPAEWRNRLIWGDKKYVLPALLDEFAGEIDLIYIDPPFATGQDFEREFAHYLQDATDIVSFAKLPRRFGFTIEYTDSATSLRYYEPDFVAVDRDGVHYVIETKGQENVDVAHKDRAAAIWCENATLLTGVTWSYIKVPQVEFGKLQPTVWSDAVVAFGAGGATTL